ncbi:DUF5056 domain-containing protein [uncultured Bacteroides sp.]|uniref:DUF5056 domain-containing protein n=1 Tax=uncultured Bacteroides sp. TaxID=162156 RepID=UPI002AAB2493|nr:DUF5056 domain-containing protein [uncultured Bacteroides sp.]
MMEKDDMLLNQFFNTQKKEIEDNGFSRRVMRKLPNRTKYLSKLWVSFCTALALILFFTMNGLQLMTNALREIFTSLIQHGIENLDPKSLLIAVVVILFLCLRKVCTMA